MFRRRVHPGVEHGRHHHAHAEHEDDLQLRVPTLPQPDQRRGSESQHHEQQGGRAIHAVDVGDFPRPSGRHESDPTQEHGEEKEHLAHPRQLEGRHEYRAHGDDQLLHHQHHSHIVPAHDPPGEQEPALVDQVPPPALHVPVVHPGCVGAHGQKRQWPEQQRHAAEHEHHTVGPGLEAHDVGQRADGGFPVGVRNAIPRYDRLADQGQVKDEHHHAHRVAPTRNPGRQVAPALDGVHHELGQDNYHNHRCRTEHAPSIAGLRGVVTHEALDLENINSQR
mmetsp:Transcript_66985/g.178636  ORF Transcript_66985/g.178636 Transcript_66985/m.178636 type:complete len:279 (+) Transcript_66985:1352-2188(+)